MYNLYDGNETIKFMCWVKISLNKFWSVLLLFTTGPKICLKENLIYKNRKKE